MNIKKYISNYDTALQPALSSATISRGCKHDPANKNKNPTQGIQEAACERIMVDPLPDIVLITNAFPVTVRMQALKDRGTNIPEDMAIMKSNNESNSRIVELDIASVNYPGICKVQIGALSSSIIVKEIQI